MKLSALVVFGLMAVAFAQDFFDDDRQTDDDEAAWNNFKNKHKKKYKNKDEEKRRRATFAQRHRKIKEHNGQGGRQHKLRINKFADWSDEELKKLKGEVEPKNEMPGPVMRSDLLSRQAVPDSVDLRNNSCMAPIKFQGGCGSCYTFAATVPLEWQRCRKTGELVTLSEENLVDCSQPFGNLGCNGGLALRAWNYVAANGINTDALYPYEGVVDTCKYSLAAKTAVIGGWAYATRTQDEEAIKVAVALYGPVAVSIDATGWEFYGSGVFSSPDCSTTYTNHAVVIVGYGTDAESGKKFWIIRNSWDVDWGLGGYILLERGVNMCAVGKRPVYPTLI